MSQVTATTRVPEPKEVRDLLADLLDRPLDLALAPVWAPDPADRPTFAIYVDDRVATRALAFVDLPFAAFAGGALGLVPPGGVQDCVAEGVLPPALEENVYEVLNICASLMNAEGAPHVRLHAVHAPSQQAPLGLMAFSRVLGRRIDLDVSIGGYGRGRLSFVVVA